MTTAEALLDLMAAIENSDLSSETRIHLHGKALAVWEAIRG